MLKKLIEFYQELDILNLIIFWGIIIVIILLIIFIILLIKKKIDLKKQEQEETYEEEKVELPIIKNKPDKSEKEEYIQEYNDKITPEHIEKENTFIAEEHIIGYQTPQAKTIIQEEHNQDNLEISKKNETKINSSNNYNIPNAPYQRNVLKEMALSQTSPIGITTNNSRNTQIRKEQNINSYNQSIKTPNIPSKIITPPAENIQNEVKTISREEMPILESEAVTSTILENMEDQKKEETSNKKYLEEVSSKLKEEVNDGIQRTEYELEQEEEAIISYKELMEKKDTIKMIDEEEAVISIEELMKLKNEQQNLPQNTQQSNEKLYNLTEEEENDNFIKELKNFRNDL